MRRGKAVNATDFKVGVRFGGTWTVDVPSLGLV
jgi:hypothetical protein